jgi:hypothetical protein
MVRENHQNNGQTGSSCLDKPALGQGGGGGIAARGVESGILPYIALLEQGSCALPNGIEVVGNGDPLLPHPGAVALPERVPLPTAPLQHCNQLNNTTACCSPLRCGSLMKVAPQCAAVCRGKPRNTVPLITAISWPSMPQKPADPSPMLGPEPCSSRPKQNLRAPW